jgi:hypothetical protein
MNSNLSSSTCQPTNSRATTTQPLEIKSTALRVQESTLFYTQQREIEKIGANVNESKVSPNSVESSLESEMKVEEASDSPSATPIPSSKTRSKIGKTISRKDSKGNKKSAKLSVNSGKDRNEKRSISPPPSMTDNSNNDLNDPPKMTKKKQKKGETSQAPRLASNSPPISLANSPQSQKTSSSKIFASGKNLVKQSKSSTTNTNANSNAKSNSSNSQFSTSSTALASAPSVLKCQPDDVLSHSPFKYSVECLSRPLCRAHRLRGLFALLHSHCLSLQTATEENERKRLLETLIKGIPLASMNLDCLLFAIFYFLFSIFYLLLLFFYYYYIFLVSFFFFFFSFLFYFLFAIFCFAYLACLLVFYYLC